MPDTATEPAETQQTWPSNEHESTAMSPFAVNETSPANEMPRTTRDPAEFENVADTPLPSGPATIRACSSAPMSAQDEPCPSPISHTKGEPSAEPPSETLPCTTIVTDRAPSPETAARASENVAYAAASSTPSTPWTVR